MAFSKTSQKETGKTKTYLSKEDLLARYLPSPTLGKRLSGIVSTFIEPSKLKNVQRVVGPITLTEHYNKALGKHVYVFGDYHVVNPHCPKATVLSRTMEIAPFIELLVTENPDKVIDLFVETKSTEQLGLSVPVRTIRTAGLTGTALSKSQSKEDKDFQSKQREMVVGSAYMLKVTNFFAPCFQRVGKNCPYPNLRAHYTELRAESLFGKYKTKWGALIKSIINLAYAQDPTSILDGLEQLAEFPLKEREVLLDDFLNDETITKQFANIKDNEVALALINDLIAGFKQYSFTAKEVQPEIWAEYYLKTGGGEHPGFTKLLDKALPFSVALMDFYLLSRLFRSYSSKFNEYADDARFIVIYVGNLHAKHIREVFKKLGFYQIRQSFSDDREGNFQCVSVNGYYPYFNWK